MAQTVTGYPGVQGRRADGVIVKGIVPQFDGSTYGGQNCGAASEAHRDIAQQEGRKPIRGAPWPPTGASIRKETGDRVGGLMPSQTQAVSRNEYGLATAAVRIDDVTDMDAALWLGYTIDLLVRYGPIDDYKSGSPGFRGNHRGVISGIRKSDSGAISYLWCDPLYDGRRSGIPLGPQWLPASVIRRAAAQLELTAGRTVQAAYGSNKAYFIPTTTRWTPTTPPAPAPTVIDKYPPTLEKNSMISSAYGVSTSRVQSLAKDQPLWRDPNGGPVITRMSKAGEVAYVGPAGGGWCLVIVQTGAPYKDKKLRPTGLYVPVAAGPVRTR